MLREKCCLGEDLDMKARSEAKPVRIFVSLTTIPSRMSGLARCISSLNAQTFKPERIYLCVPETYRRFETPKHLPFAAAEFGENVEVIRCNDDGPGTKVIGSLERLPSDSNALLVLVDDDAHYEPHMLAVFAEIFGSKPEAASSFYVYKYRGIDIGQGKDGFAIPVGALSGLRDFHASIRQYRYLFYVDDLWISFYLWMNNIPVLSLAQKSGSTGYIRQVYNDVDALANQTGHYTRRRTMSRSLWYLLCRFGLKGLWTRATKRRDFQG